jgi:hypothetical protein
MEPHEPTPIPPSPPGDAALSGSTPSVSDAASAAHGQSGAFRLWALGAGVGAALASWLLIEATLGTFKPATSATRFGASTFLIPGSQERAAAATRNAALALGLTGATVGLALGLAGGLARQSPRAVTAGAAAFLGLVLGAGAGAGTALVALPVATLVHDRDPGNLSAEMVSSLLIHGGTWGAIGAVGGLAFGIGLGGRSQAIRGLLGGLLGAVAGAILYELIGELAVPGSKIMEPVAATWGVRLLAQAMAVIPATVATAASVSARTSPRHQPALDTR